jgi:Tfp pilus assembly pilus retraction ATPase PilT
MIAFPLNYSFKTRTHISHSDASHSQVILFELTIQFRTNFFILKKVRNCFNMNVFQVESRTANFVRLILWSKVLLEKLTVSQLVKEFSDCYRTLSLVTM